MEEAERHCDRLAIMDCGRLVAQATPQSLLEEYDATSLDDVFAAATGRRLEGAEDADDNVVPAP